MPNILKIDSAKRFKRIDFVFLAPLLLYLPLLVFEGALRYYLWHAGLEALVYIPKGLMIILFWIMIVLALARNSINKAFLFILIILCIAFFVGLYYTTGCFLQAGFGLWVYTPMLYGAVILPSFVNTEKKGTIFVLSLWTATTTGLLWDFFAVFPWVGFDYELGKAAIEGSRKWSTFGIERCAGFARASYSAANLILFSAIYLGVKNKNKIFVVCIWILSGIGLVITTHKTAIGIYIAITLLAPFLFFYFRTALIPWLYRALPVMVALVGISMPLMSGFVTLSPNSKPAKLILASVGMRFSDTWPDAISLIHDNGNLILGRGIGGIGSPQKYFESAEYNPADNMYLSLYASFGIGMLLLVGMLVYRMLMLDLRIDSRNKLFWFWGIAILLEGWTINAVEDPLVSIIFGLSLGYTGIKGRRVHWKR